MSSFTREVKNMRASFLKLIFLLMLSWVIVEALPFTPSTKSVSTSVNVGSRDQLNSTALLAQYYLYKPEAPRGIKTEIVRTAEGFAPRFDGEIEPRINDPRSRWKNPAKPVLPVFPKTFDGAMSVHSTFEVPGTAGVPPAKSATGGLPTSAVLPSASGRGAGDDGKRQTFTASATPLNANHAIGELTSDGALIYRKAFDGADVMYRCGPLKTEEFIVIWGTSVPPAGTKFGLRKSDLGLDCDPSLGISDKKGEPRTSSQQVTANDQTASSPLVNQRPETGDRRPETRD